MVIVNESEIWCLRFRWSRVDGEGGVCDGVVDKGALALEASARGGERKRGDRSIAEIVIVWQGIFGMHLPEQCLHSS